MEISADHIKDKSVITIEKNKLIGVESEEFQKLVQESIDMGSGEIIVDLTKVEYISSWGIGLLVHAYTSCHNKNIKFGLAHVNQQVMNVLSQLKLTTLFNII